MPVEFPEFRVVVQFPGVGGADADIRLHDQGIPHRLRKRKPRFHSGNHMLACCGNPGIQEQLFHQGFFLDEANPVGPDPGGDVEVGPQLCVLLQPVFVHGFDPVDLSVPECEERDGTVYLVVILQAVHPVVLGQGRLQRGFQPVVRRVPDAQHIHTVPVQPVAELPVGMRKMR